MLATLHDPGPVDYPQARFAFDQITTVLHSREITHLDSLAHCAWDGRMYNDVDADRVTRDGGALVNGIGAAARGIVTRGILIDAPLVRDGARSGAGIGRADLIAAKQICGVTPEAGDVVLIRAGEDQRRSGALPEILPDLHRAEIAVLGSDTGNDVRPSGYDRFTHPVHQIGLVAMGLWILDALMLTDLAEACRTRGRWEFLICISAIPLAAATASPVTPIAVF